ncbi:hypothetical protein MIH18_06995 [Marinobacter sp. M3C]|uniref:hypothetical protein n=1 Tax=unclassified Marinobacter TaxID=83889 RepID=UPI0020105C41|nr:MULTISPECIES: hypothetical protein [unclassified Marinobacter]MCL1479057.1 hypothetical protein [Marinobacter sp.]MCL1488975.1 hypothetical protein [Marinobacter sp.]UQG57135.1 hypothetical protein MIH16_05675 [Marinobacter sp. M4C]UQG61683.1 hypothetical protein MIH18_06995 [Marinobacter sp. M3C]UQG65939.1 hypothetical protein MIH17_05675 [Marinobacter sp. M2C]
MSNMETPTFIKKYKGNLTVFFVVLGVFFLCCSFVARAQAPEVSLQISKSSTGLVQSWSLGKVDALSQQRITTHSPFFPGTKTFSGPLLADLLAAAFSAEPKESTPIKLIALNNYSIQTTFGKLKHADAIVATRKNDLPMSIRDRGPFWIILPLNKRPDLENENFYRLMIWQLSDIIIGESQ